MEKKKNNCLHEEWKDKDDAQVRNYLRRTYPELANKNLIDDWLTDYADRNSFHEVKEFFCNLPQWDGTPRAEEILINFLRADDTPYTREITLNWLTAAVARIFYPGCDYQLAPILLGEQGIGKSYLIKRLGGKWYGSLIDDVSDPHAVDAIQKIWLVEIKEMAAMKKDVDANKRFIDASEDVRRNAYERRAGKIKRHCVFLVTTNNKQCLFDITGNRRHPVIPCHSKPRDYVVGLTDDYIQQLWSEVFYKFNEMFKDGFDERLLELSRPAQLQADETAEQYLRDDIGEEIKSFLSIKIPPTVIWYLLSRSERRKFFVEGYRISIEEGDLETRFKNFAGRNFDKLKVDFETAISDTDTVRIVELSTKENGLIRNYVFYGSEYRQHICPAEIFHEAFDKTDRRKSMIKILESLGKLEDWTQGKRIQNRDPAYNDQKVVFYREQSPTGN